MAEVARTTQPVSARSRSRRNPLVEPMRSYLPAHVVRQLEELERRMLDARHRAETAYARGDLEDAERWDVISEQFADELEHQVAEVEVEFEHEPEIPGREPHWVAPLVREDYGFEDDLQYEIAHLYAEWKAGFDAELRGERPTGRQLTKAMMADIIRDRVRRDPSYGVLVDVSDDEIFEGARDVYEHLVTIRERQRESRYARERARREQEREREVGRLANRLRAHGSAGRRPRGP